MTKYFGYKYLVNRSEIIEVYENPLGHFYCLLHKVCVKRLKKFISTTVVLYILVDDQASKSKVMMFKLGVRLLTSRV